MKNYKTNLCRENHYNFIINQNNTISCILSQELMDILGKNRQLESFPCRKILNYSVAIIGCFSDSRLDEKMFYLPGDCQQSCDKIDLKNKTTKELNVIFKSISWACQIYDSIIDNDIEKYNKLTLHKYKDLNI